MLVDEFEQYDNDRTDEIVVSRSGSEEEPEAELVANDCTASSSVQQYCVYLI
jgi:ubiquitin carboxyl-terminal hydrolase 7